MTYDPRIPAEWVAAPVNADNPEWVAGWVADAPPPARAAFYAALPKAARDAALAALDDARQEHDRAVALAERGHYCFDHFEWAEDSTPCPTCPGSPRTCYGAVCGVCGEVLYTSSHAHVDPPDSGLPPWAAYQAG